MKKDKLRKEMRERAMKLLQFAADNGIEHVSMFADLKDGEPFIYAMASNGGNNLMAPIAEFVDGGADE